MHEEFLMHPCKHDSFNVAGDTVLGKSLFQSLCADLPSVSSSYVQCNSWGSCIHGSWGRSSSTKRWLLHLWRGSFCCQLPRSQRWTQGSWQSWYWSGWPWWFLSSGAHARGRGVILCTHLKGSPCRLVGWCGRQVMEDIVTIV